MKARMLICLLGFMVSLMSINAQTTDDTLTANDGTYWTLPTEECGGDNLCEIRVSPQGTIYSWDNINRILYLSPQNQDDYETYDLSEFSDYLGFGTDFVLFETEGVVFFFSSFGGWSNSLTRYDLNAGVLQEFTFPSDYRPIGCNRSMGVNQRRLRLIFPLGLDGHLMACTDSPQGRAVIHIIDVNTLNIEQTLDIEGRFVDIIQPSWQVAGGLDNRIYVLHGNPEVATSNLPIIDVSIEEIILIFDLDTSSWSYEIKPIENTFEILGVFPDSTTLFQNYTPEGREVIQFDDEFNILRRFGQAAWVFLGITLEGDIFFSQGNDYGNILVSNISDYPLIDAEAD